MAFQPGLPGSQFQGQSEDYLVRRIQDLEKAVQQLAAANVFAPMGVTPTANGFTVTGTETVTGALIVNGPETVNGTQTVNGPLNVNGAMAVTGTLSLPAGIIGNDALTAPVVISTSGLSQNNFATTTAGAVYASATVTVPAGYSQADVLCMVVGGAINSTASADFLYVASSINGIAGGETPQLAAASGGYASAAANGIRTLTGLSGGTITVACQIRTGAAWAASASNFANMNATIFFRR
jgi:hypothetical protein